MKLLFQFCTTLLAVIAAVTSDPSLTVAVNASKSKTIVELAVATKDLSTLVAALKAGDLVDTLSGPGPFTVFAPTNKAFDALPAGVVTDLLKPENKAQLVDLLTYHVAPGTVKYPCSSKIHRYSKFSSLTTVEGQNVTVKVCKEENALFQPVYFVCLKTSSKYVSLIIQENIEASNGIIHLIDRVLTVPTPPAPKSNTIVDLAVATKDLSTLVTALKAGDLVDTLSGPGPFTVFAPTNEAFDALPAGVVTNLLKPENKAQLDDVLTYHVISGVVHSKNLWDGEMLKTVEGKYVTVRISGNDIFINSAKVTTADIDGSNGVVHIVDSVLDPGPIAPTPAPAPVPTSNTIVDLAVATKDLSTLVTALKAGDLVDTLSGPGPFTVFAPTNEAFDALPAAVLANLLDPKNKAQLDDILTYHVVPGPVHSQNLLDGERLKTVEGKYVMVNITGSDIFINGAKVTTADIDGSNGVVHIIDSVLMPDSSGKFNGPEDVIASGSV